MVGACRDARVRFEPRGLATGIGSLPLQDGAAAAALVLRYLPECPYWPQLPRRTPLEGMTLQYVARFPSLRSAGPGRDPQVDTGAGGADELAEFYERVLAGDLEPFGLDAERAAGLGAFEVALTEARPEALRFVKGHVTGPVTLASSLHDLDGRELLYDDTYREAVGAFLAQSIRWQVRRLARFGVPVVLFLDEPAMEVFGSAYSSALTPELVLSLWRPCLDAAREEGAISGIHCCGNTDWGFLFEAGPDIVNFDAFHFLERMLLYPGEVGRYLEAGGTLAWGLVPTDEAAVTLSADALVARFEDGMARFAAAGVDPGLLLRQCLLTPSCGMGSLAPDLAERILSLLVEVSRLIRGGRRT